MEPVVNEIGALLDSRVEACRKKDIDALMSLYAPDVVYFDVVPPLRFVGAEAVRRNFVRWFDEYEGPIGLETEYLEVTVDGDVAFAHMLHLDTGTMTGDAGPVRSMWLRSTVCLRRSAGTWSITHEHISLPIRPETMKAALDLTP